MKNKFIKFNYEIIFIVLILVLLNIVVNLDFVDCFDSAYGPEIRTNDYVISRSKVQRLIGVGNVFRDNIKIQNLKNRELDVSFAVDDYLSDVIELESQGIIITPQNTTEFLFLVKGDSVGNYSGELRIQGSIEESILVNVSVTDNLHMPLIIEARLGDKKFYLDKELNFYLDVYKLKPEIVDNVTFTYNLVDLDNKTYFLGSEMKTIINSYQVVKKFDLPDGLREDNYIFQILVEYENTELENTSIILLRRSFFNILVFGFIPMWLILIFLGLFLVGGSTFYFVRRSILKRKKYQMKLDTKTIPKKNPDFFYLGKVAETNIPAYLEPNRMTTHTIVAGATGGGKSISAQVIIEEALLHNIAVLVFDPTAQWSGMLRKCDDKKMLSYYPKFGLKEGDSRAFKGNVRQVKNARELIDVSKHMNPGQIQIFSLNKLDPKDMDVFVANVIRQVFKSDPKESPDLKLILVFDEVHRLLSKFGGSGEGFLQVERACREFRKWGIGVMLVSQVLSDFVGEIKANISSEVQMRTRDEGDLKRIETKYGDEFLKSLVKASVGVGMFVNPAYNHAKPYFINFRPILHNTRRLSDEELDKYNKYNDIVDDLDFQIEQLEKEKVDVFDLKMELKLVKDKIMTGSFSVVDIYLEGVTPRVTKEWSKLGKKPKKRQLLLVSEDDIKKSVEEAKKAHNKMQVQEQQAAALSKKKAVKKVDLQTKQIKPFIFDNGIMVSSLKEMKDVLVNIDDEIFKTHVNEKKNDISKWISENISPAQGEKLKVIIDKHGLSKAIGLIKAVAKPVAKPVVAKPVAAKPVSGVKPAAAKPVSGVKPAAAKPVSGVKPAAAKPAKKKVVKNVKKKNVKKKVKKKLKKKRGKK